MSEHIVPQAPYRSEIEAAEEGKSDEACEKFF
jgi:hypothetical protein